MANIDCFDLSAGGSGGTGGNKESWEDIGEDAETGTETSGLDRNTCGTGDFKVSTAGTAGSGPLGGGPGSNGGGDLVPLDVDLARPPPE